MEETRKERRSFARILVDPPFQKFFALLIIIILVVIFVLILFCIRVTIEDTKREIMVGRTKVGAYEALGKVKNELLTRIGWILVPGFIVSGALGIYFIHRVAGPAYRLHRVLEHIAKGELPSEIKLRRTDFLKNIAGDLNSLVSYLKKERGAARRLIDALEEYKREEQDPGKRSKIDSIIESLKSI